MKGKTPVSSGLCAGGSLERLLQVKQGGAVVPSDHLLLPAGQGQGEEFFYLVFGAPHGKISAE